MTPNKTTTAASPSPSAATANFTVDRANRALVLVRKVVADVVVRYRELSQLQDERERLVATPGLQERVEAVSERIAACIEDLNALRRELHAVGCTLKDWRTGLVDFPALNHGQPVWLCWRLGEPAIAHWHDYNEGFNARKPIDENFG